MECHGEIKQVAAEIEKAEKILTAIGDEGRLHLILAMMKAYECNGMRVNDIAAQTNLSRPAVSHHLKILKEGGLIKMRREGTRNYYYFDPDMDSLNALIDMLTHVRELMKEMPDRSREK